MDPRGIGTVSIELNNTAAQLLASLCVELESEDPQGVLSRALGLLDLVVRTRKRGGRLCFVNQQGEMSDVIVMSERIDLDHRRFRQIIRGKIKQNLRKYISHGEMVARKGKSAVSIPLPSVDIPHFRFGEKQQGGVAQGDGDPGDVLGQGEVQPGAGEAGDRPGEHLVEVEVSLDELAEILGEELALPRIEPKGSEKIVAWKDKYTGIRKTGPESLRHFRRTFKQALRRQISSGQYNPKDPIVVPIRDDRRYRSWRTEPQPQSNAVIVYMMDVSGSMGDEQKEIVRIESFWIDTWLRSQYQGIESRYIIHDAMAKEVDRDTFFRTRESGGTMISSAYKLCAKMIEDEYPSDQWNIYPFHFSDGDNWSVDDTVTCVELLRTKVLPVCNQFAYGQVESPYGSGQFIKDLQEHFPEEERLVTSEIKGKEAIMDSIRDFLGEGQVRAVKPLPTYLHDCQEEIEGFARAYGLDFFPIIYEVLDYKTMNEVAAFGGFPTRYPHWRFGMDYEQLSKGYEFGLQKIYEMVINTNPAYAYLLEGNSLVDQKIVMAHVAGHVDFFKNNYYFSKTNRKMIDGMANHASTIRRHMSRWGVDAVEEFIDVGLSLENLIDPMSPYIQRSRVAKEEEGDRTEEIPRLRAKGYMDKFINPPEFLEQQKKKIEAEKQKKKKFPEEPQRDILQFLINNAPLDRWQRDVLEIIRAEAYYFAPQAMTKIINEGWACLLNNSAIFTERGLLTIEDVVREEAFRVFDGERAQRVYDKNIIFDHETVTMKTRRGLELCGSNNHRVLLADRTTWRRLDELQPGDRVAISGGGDLWPQERVRSNWMPRYRVTIEDVAARSGMTPAQTYAYWTGTLTRHAAAFKTALVEYEREENLETPSSVNKRAPIRIPVEVDERVGAFLGYLVGDGHISKRKRNLGLTTADEEQANAFHYLAKDLFDVTASMDKDEGRWRVLLHSEHLSDFLVEFFGMTTGPSAREKKIPDPILRSPEPVVRAFLRAYFDCDGYAGKAGVILSTMSDKLAEQVQLLLMNYGILSRRRRQTDGCWHVHVMGASAKRFAERIGFGLERKEKALDAYVTERRWFKAEKWEDEVVSLERGRHDVYDISVEETHRYAAGGFINHNSYWHSKIMTDKALSTAEIIDYADACSGVLATAPGRLNPYKLGIELFRNIEMRWNQGQFGKEWEECDSLAAKRDWDLRLGLGRKKVFEVRRLYNDITFIDEFFTLEFCLEQKFYSFGFNERSGNWEIMTRDFKKVKDQLLKAITNRGQPFMYVEDGNHNNRGELLLRHAHEGVDLDLAQARDTLKNLFAVWTRPVNVLTRIDNKGKLLRWDESGYSDKSA